MRLALLFVALGALGCEAVDPVYASDETITYECPARPFSGKRRLLVIDTQLDPTLPELSRSLAGCYHTECNSAGECRVEPGVTLKRRQKSRTVPADPAAWNAAVADKRTPESLVALIEQPVFGEGPSSDHGTGVSSVAMYGLDDIELVFLQIRLRVPGERVMCPTASEMEEAIAPAKDPARRTELTRGPLNPYETSLFDMIRRERIDVINASFGLSRVEIESSCPGLPWAERFEVEAALARERETFLESQGSFDGIALTVVQSAGNSGVRVDSARDVDWCHSDRSSGFGARSKTLVVGSYDPSAPSRLSSFTNHGSCVDVYAPGERILAADASGLLRPLDGTSFAAPLVARLIASTPPEPGVEPAARVKALASNKLLPLAVFPGALLFDDKSTTRAVPGR